VKKRGIDGLMLMTFSDVSPYEGKAVALYQPRRPSPGPELTLTIDQWFCTCFKI